MDKKNILTKIKELFNSEVERFEGTDYKTQDGRIIRCYGGGLEVGEMVKEITSEGEVDIEDGNYVLEDGIVLIIKGGMIESVEEEMEEVTDTITEDVSMIEQDKDMVEEDKMADLETTLMDGTKVRVIGGELVVGAKVEAEIDGKYINAPEGQHNLADGRVIYVDADGLINEIETPDTKKEDEEMSDLFSAVSKLVDEVKSLKNEVKLIKEENDTLKSKFGKFSKEPSDTKTTHEVKLSTMSKDDRLKFFGKK